MSDAVMVCIVHTMFSATVKKNCEKLTYIFLCFSLYIHYHDLGKCILLLFRKCTISTVVLDFFFCVYQLSFFNHDFKFDLPIHLGIVNLTF